MPMTLQLFSTVAARYQPLTYVRSTQWMHDGDCYSYTHGLMLATMEVLSCDRQ